MKPDAAAAIALQGLNSGKEEIHVGMAGFMFAMSRVMPKRALTIINGFIPANVEELLGKELK